MSDQPPPLPSVPEEKPAPTAADRLNAAPTKFKAWARSFAGRGKSAAQLLAKQSVRTKLTKITLPNAYRALGKHVHSSGTFRAELTDAYGRIDALLTDIAKLTAAGPAVEGFKQKAMAVAKAVKNKAQAQALQPKLNYQYTELGRAAFDKHGEHSGSPDVVKPILDCRVRLETLAAEMAELSKSAPATVLTPKRIAIGGLAVAALLLILVVKVTFFGGGSDARQLAKNGGETGQGSVGKQIVGTWNYMGNELRFTPSGSMVLNGMRTQVAKYTLQNSRLSIHASAYDLGYATALGTKWHEATRRKESSPEDDRNTVPKIVTFAVEFPSKDEMLLGEPDQAAAGDLAGIWTRRSDTDEFAETASEDAQPLGNLLAIGGGLALFALLIGGAFAVLGLVVAMPVWLILRRKRNADRMAAEEPPPLPPQELPPPLPPEAQPSQELPPPLPPEVQPNSDATI